MDPRTKRRLSSQKRREKRRSTNVFGKLSQEKIQLYKEMFTMIDQDGDGAISKQDLKSMLTSLGVSDISEESLMQMLTESTGTLNFTAFLAMFAQMTSDMDNNEVKHEHLYPPKKGFQKRAFPLKIPRNITGKRMSYTLIGPS